MVASMDAYSADLKAALMGEKKEFPKAYTKAASMGQKKASPTADAMADSKEQMMVSSRDDKKEWK